MSGGVGNLSEQAHQQWPQRQAYIRSCILSESIDYKLARVSNFGSPTERMCFYQIRTAIRVTWEPKSQFS